MSEPNFADSRATFDLTALPLPIVQAPMAGGPSTPELAIAVSEAGGLGFLAAGYKRAPAVRDEIRTVCARTSAPFGVNLFVPSPEAADPAVLREYLNRIAPEAERQGTELGEARFDDDDWAAKLEVMYEERPAVASFTFGCPQRALLAERRPTRVTRAFTGRAARGIVNRFMTEHSSAAPTAYPEIHHVTSPLRAAARREGDAGAFNLWAGQAHELVQARPAAEIVREMAAEARAVLDRVSAARPDPDTSAGRR